MTEPKPNAGTDARSTNPAPAPMRLQLLRGDLASDPAALADFVAAIKADGRAMDKVLERVSEEIAPPRVGADASDEPVD